MSGGRDGALEYPICCIQSKCSMSYRVLRISPGVRSAKGEDRGERGPATYAPDADPGSRVPGAERVRQTFDAKHPTFAPSAPLVLARIGARLVAMRIPTANKLLNRKGSDTLGSCRVLAP